MIFCYLFFTCIIIFGFSDTVLANIASFEREYFSLYLYLVFSEELTESTQMYAIFSTRSLMCLLHQCHIKLNFTLVDSFNVYFYIRGDLLHFLHDCFIFFTQLFLSYLVFLHEGEKAFCFRILIWLKFR